MFAVRRSAWQSSAMTKTWTPAGVAKPAQRALAGAGISSLEGLAARREGEVAALHGMGPKALGILKAAMAARGLTFAA
jgi:hypothetical protein